MEAFSFDAPRTKSYKDILNSLNQQGKTTFLVTSDYEKNIFLSSRNLQKTKVKMAGELSTYDILHANTLILSEGAIEKIVSNF